MNNPLDFKSDTLYVARTKAEIEVFCKTLDNHGYIWNTGKSYLEFTPYRGLNTVYFSPCGGTWSANPLRKYIEVKDFLIDYGYRLHHAEELNPFFL
jgi:hypothetical protein